MEVPEDILVKGLGAKVSRPLIYTLAAWGGGEAEDMSLVM